jgi:hypothetical protein
VTSDDPEGDASESEQPDSLMSRLYERWQPPPAHLLTPDRLERRRLAEAMRVVIERLIATGAPDQFVIEAADELERIAARFADIPHDPTYEGYRETANVGADLHASFEFSPFIGRANPLSPPMTLEDRGDEVHGFVCFGSAYEGPPGCVHGGYVAAAFDELLGATQSLSGAPGMTGTLTVKYRSPTPLHRDLEMVGRIVDISGRKILTRGTVHVGDRLCAEAEGLFISIDASVFLRLKEERERRGTISGGD